MPPPFRIGVMQLTMEPLDEMLESARVMDRAGLDTIWLAEAYPWWRKHGMEARSSTVTSALIARETERLTIGWGIISPFTRHPVQAAMDARVVQEAAGPERFILGFGTSKIFLNNADMQTKRTLGPMRDAVEIVRGVLAGGAFEYRGETWSASVPALQDAADTPRAVPPVYVAATAPKMQALAGELADGCLTPSITTPPFVRYTCGNVAADIDIGCTIVASIHESDREAGRGHAGRLHRRDRGVPRRGLHARTAGALGRSPPRADPTLRRTRVAALPLDGDDQGPREGNGDGPGRRGGRRVRGRVDRRRSRRSVRDDGAAGQGARYRAGRGGGRPRPP